LWKHCGFRLPPIFEGDLSIGNTHQIWTVQPLRAVDGVLQSDDDRRSGGTLRLNQLDRTLRLSGVA
jgi:hypothetical protein